MNDPVHTYYFDCGLRLFTVEGWNIEWPNRIKNTWKYLDSSINKIKKFIIIVGICIYNYKIVEVHLLTENFNLSLSIVVFMNV